MRLTGGAILPKVRRPTWDGPATPGCAVLRSPECEDLTEAWASRSQAEVACGAAALRPKKDEGCGPENPELKTRKSHYSTDETGIKQVTTVKRIKILTLTIFTGYLDYQSSQDNPIALK